MTSDNQNFHRQAHSIWDCKYHVVWIPKYRRKELYGNKRRIVVDTIKQWARIKGVEIIEEHAMPDHIHLCVSIPPKYSVARVQILNRSTVLIGLGIAYMETGRLHEVESAFNNTLRVLHSFSATELQQCAKEL